MNEESKVIFKDPEDKLYEIGFTDGKEKTKRNIEKSLPTTIQALNPRGPKRYLEGFVAGNEEAIKENTENLNLKKFR